jgi:hypothetical protein
LQFLFQMSLFALTVKASDIPGEYFHYKFLGSCWNTIVSGIILPVLINISPTNYIDSCKVGLPLFFACLGGGGTFFPGGCAWDSFLACSER